VACSPGGEYKTLYVGKAGKGVQSVEELNEWVPFYWRESDMIALLTATVKDLIQRIEQLENSN
jgi:hypothetical protein